MNLPTIGCVKSVLLGWFDTLGSECGITQPIFDRDEVIGMAVRIRTGVSPVYVSAGHNIDLQTVVEWVLNCGKGYRIQNQLV